MSDEELIQSFSDHWFVDTPEAHARLIELARIGASVMPRPNNLAVVIGDIEAERLRQITNEGWSAEHDDRHDNGEMATAAACYIERSNSSWPWDLAWWKPKARRRDLVRAAALIVAEIERLDRAAVAKVPA